MSDQDNQATQTARDIALQYEARLLGSLLLQPDQFEDVAEIVGFDDFVDKKHSDIFQAISALREAKEPVHALSVSENLAKSAALIGVQSNISLPFLQDLANRASSAGARSDARKVRERSALRRLYDTGEHIMRMSESATMSPGEIVEQISDLVTETTKTIDSKGAMVENFVPYEKAMEIYISKLTALTENPEINDGIRTGIESLDDYLQFLSPGYHVIAARPGCGKTALALAMATNAYESTERDPHSGVGCLVQSLEMPIDKLMMRLMAQKSGVDIQKLRRGQLDDTEWSMITKGMSDMQSLIGNFWMDPTRNLTTSDFAARLRRFVREKKSRNGLVIIDYLQLMSPPAGMRLSMNSNPLDYVSQAVAGFAKEFGLVIVALAQLNREVEKRANKRPIMSDLKGSGQIEQDADSISFLYRDPSTPNLVEDIIAKNREGEPNHTIDLGFSGAKQRFFTVEQRTPEQREAMAYQQLPDNGRRDSQRGGGRGF